MVSKQKRPALCLIHGWGADTQVWQFWAEQYLAKAFQLYYIELPGFGDQPVLDLPYKTDALSVNQAWLEALTRQLPIGPSWILGWSLGGLMAQQLFLQRPEEVLGIINLASTPCFQQGQGWRYGVSPSLMIDFIHALEKDVGALLNRFYALQCQGGEQARELTKQLRKQYLNRGLPSAKGLYQGLQLLQSLDLREKMSNNSSPCLWLLGEDDPLVKSAGVAEWVNQSAAGEVELISGAAHIPFLSHPDLTSHYIIEFIQTELNLD